MKKFAKLIALVLVLVLVLSLAACKKSGDKSGEEAVKAPSEPTVVGKWKGNVSMDVAFEAAAQQNAASKDSIEQAKTLLGEGAEFIMYIELTEDGKAVMSADKESVQKLMDTMVNNIPTVLPQLFGMSAEEFNQQLEAQGMTMDQFVDMMKEQMNPEELMGQMEDEKGIYKLEGDKLFFAEEGKEFDENNYAVVSYTTTTLTITDIKGADNDAMKYIEYMIPWTLNRAG